MAKINQVLEQQAINILETVEKQVDANIEKLDNLDDDELIKIRRKRIEELKKTQENRERWLSNGHGMVTEVTDDQELIAAIEKSERIAIAFYRPCTWRCDIVEKHFQTLASEHIETRFIRIDVEKRCPYIIEKLNIRVIPTIQFIRDKQAILTIPGFDSFGGSDDFPTSALKNLMLFHNMLHES